MGKYVYKGVERFNQLNYSHSHFTPKNIIAVIDENDCLTIFTRDEPHLDAKIKRIDLEITFHKGIDAKRSYWMAQAYEKAKEILLEDSVPEINNMEISDEELPDWMTIYSTEDDKK